MTRMPFGKYKGQALRDLPHEYIARLIFRDDSDLPNDLYIALVNEHNKRVFPRRDDGDK